MPRRFWYDYCDYGSSGEDEDDPDYSYPHPTPKKKIPPKSPKKRTSASPSETKSASLKKRKKAAVEKKGDQSFPLFDLPAEIIDQILADPVLHLRDHLCLAASCRTLRAAYYTPLPRGLKPESLRYTSDVWRVLCSNRPFVGRGGWIASPGKFAIPNEEDEKLLNHLFSREDKVEPEEVVVAHRAVEWEEAIDAINTQNITKTTAKTKYKLTDAQLARVACYQKPNPHHRSTMMSIYNEAAVESLALELHGGASGHEELLRKRAASSAKRADNKAKRAAGLLDSPSPSKKSKTSAVVSSSSAPNLAPTVALDNSGEDSSDGEYRPGRESSPTPVAGQSKGLWERG
ncbi:hypothetical protein JCM11251_007646 [Rhodosporidiobolus azoricus]